MRFISLTLLWLLWAGIVSITPDSVYWRDSGEFIIQAFALDITHPAGFPLYGMVGNLFALLPLGPIPWRVILLSGAAAIIVCRLCYELLRILVPQTRTANAAIGIATAAVLLLCASLIPAVIKQVFSAEVYLLNSALLLGIALLIVCSLQRKDFRLMAIAAFIGGLSAGNHISAIASALPLSLFIVLIDKRSRINLLTLSALFLFGLAVYDYLPLRSLASPPLNTGAPDSLQSFWNVVSDARDRHLRVNPSPLESGAELAGFDRLIANPLLNVAHDLGKFKLIPPVIIVGLTLTAFAVLLGVRWKETLCLSIVAGGNYLFFSGWDGDPWLPMLSLMTIIWLAALMIIISKFTRPPIQTAIIGALLAVLIFLYPVQDTIVELTFFKDYRDPARISESWLGAVSGDVVITENSWFLAKYLSVIEGIGDEKIMVYQPALLFPEYFSPVRINSGGMFDSRADAREHGAHANEPSYGTLGRFIERVSATTPIVIEASAPINAVLTPILNFNKQGLPEIHRGKTANAGENEIFLTERLESIAHTMRGAHAFVTSDAQNYFENVLNSTIDLLRRAKRSETALRLLQSFCLRDEYPSCSVVSLNHLGLVLTEEKKYSEAVQLYRRLIEKNPGETQRLTENLRAAERGMKTIEEKAEAR